MNRIVHHPILGDAPPGQAVRIFVDGRPLEARGGEMIAAALLASGVTTMRHTKKDKPRGIFCGIGRCTDCIMTVNGVPNVRTCVTPVEDGMHIETQKGAGSWEADHEPD